MERKLYPVRRLTEAEEAIVDSLAEKVALHFKPQIEVQAAVYEEAKAAAESAEQNYKADPRAMELHTLFFGPDQPKRELKASDPEKYRAMYQEFATLNGALTAAKKAANVAENDLDDVTTLQEWQRDHAMFTTGKALGRAEGARLALDFLLPQLHKADMPVTLTPALLTLITATDTALLEMEGGAVEC